MARASPTAASPPSWWRCECVLIVGDEEEAGEQPRVVGEEGDRSAAAGLREGGGDAVGVCAGRVEAARSDEWLDSA